MIHQPPTTTLFPYTTLFRSSNSDLSVSRNSSTSTDNTLTIANGATVRSQEHMTELHLTFDSVNSIMNKRIISADISGSSLTISPDVFTNNATVQAINGSALW